MSTNLMARPSLGRHWDPRLAATLAVVLVFLTGAAAGALLMDLGIHPHQRQPIFGTPANQAASFDRVQRELDLTPTQAEQVQSILNDMWQYYRTVLSDSKSRVEQVLTPEQRAKFELLLQQQPR